MPWRLNGDSGLIAKKGTAKRGPVYFPSHAFQLINALAYPALTIGHARVVPVTHADPDAMTIATDQALYRARTFYRKEGAGKGYRYSLEMLDERTQQVMATCDLVGRASFAVLALVDEQQVWRMGPNRKIMPSRWIVTDPQQRVVMQFEQSILGKLSNPLHKVAFSLLDGEGKVIYCLLDPRTSIADRLLGIGPDDWVISAGDRLAARLVRLPRQPKAPGLLGALKALLRSTDPAILSMGPQHAFPAPVALGLLMLFQELTDASAGA